VWELLVFQVNRSPQRSTAQYFLYLVGLILFAVIAGYVAIWLSFHYQFHDKLVSWYFPHGVRVIALFVLPFRHWCIFLCFTIIGSDSYYHLHFVGDEGISTDTLKNFALYYMMEALTGGIVYLIYQRYVKDWFSLQGLMGLILLSVLYRFVYLIAPAYFEFGFFTLMPADRYIEFFVAIQISGYLVGFYILSIVLIIKWVVEKKHDDILTTNKPYFIYLVIVLGSSCALYYFDPSLEYLLRIAILIPLILFAARYGWFAGMFTSIVIVTFLFVSLFNHPSAELLEYQPFLLMYLLISLIVSAVVYDNELINKRHIATQKELEANNKKLIIATDRMTGLSRKIIHVQEEERKFLSKELHDEIGQNIIALKSSIYLLEKSKDKAINFASLKEDANMIYSSVYELMHWLRPATLDKYGLIETLKGDFFREKLPLADIQYTASIDVSVLLDEHVETALFRICQEAVNNTLKHSDASQFSINLSCQDNTLNLTIRDNGTNNNEHIEPSGGFGLDSIYERVLTLNGLCLFTRQNGFVINIKVPV
jgi:glucose-6-phosphate-specific signal transduction histidine kinase